MWTTTTSSSSTTSIDTGGTMEQAVNIVKEYGARDIYLCFVHPVLSSSAVTSAWPACRCGRLSPPTPCRSRRRSGRSLGDRLVVLSVAPLLGEVIRRAHEGRSVGEMFNE